MSMFGIYPPKVKVTIASGRVVDARTVAGHWNPGMYTTTVSQKDRESWKPLHDRAEAVAAELRRTGKVPVALTNGDGSCMDGTYDLALGMEDAPAD